MELVLKREDGSTYQIDSSKATRKDLIKWICDNSRRPRDPVTNNELLASDWQAWSKDILLAYVENGTIPARGAASPAATGSLESIIADIARGAASKAIDEDKVIELIKKYSSKPIEYVVPLPNGKEIRSDKKQHKMFPLVLAMVRAKINTYLHGSFGSGKTRMAEEICKLLGVDYHIIPMSPGDSTAYLAGYMWGANEYVRSMIRDCMEYGKAAIIDEMDNSNPSVILKLCAALSSRSMTFPDGKRIDAHQDFFVVACGNTTLTGASAQARGRVAQDFAMIDRFAMVQIEEDRSLTARQLGIEIPCEPVDITAGGVPTLDAWWQHYCKAQDAQAKLAMPRTISPRAAIIGRDMINAGIGRDWIDSCVLYRSLTSDQIARLQAEGV